MKASADRARAESLGATVTASSMRLIRLLVGRPPQPVSALVEATGVTRTAVTEQLNDLIASGFVERTREPSEGRGRPRHIYSATRAAMVLLFAGNQQLVVPAMWRAIAEIGGDELTRKIRRRVSRALAEHYKAQMRAKKPEKRLRELSRLMRSEGSLVEVARGGDGQLVLRKRSCAFISMFEESRAVCCIDQEMMSEVVGAPVRQIACRHESQPCCVFELSSVNGK
jgi:predicted ArsR family transcriptional regulator